LREECGLSVSENRVLRRIFGPKKERDAVTMEWIKLHNEELNDLYSLPNIFQVIKLKIKWDGHVAGMGENQLYTGFWWGGLREGVPFGRPNIDGMIILRWILRK
jgi:hypothetical protein